MQHLDPQQASVLAHNIQATQNWTSRIGEGQFSFVCRVQAFQKTGWTDQIEILAGKGM